MSATAHAELVIAERAADEESNPGEMKREK